MQSILLKTPSRFLHADLRVFLKSKLKELPKTRSLQFQAVYNFSFDQDNKEDRDVYQKPRAHKQKGAPSYDSIVQSLSSQENYNDLLAIFEKNEANFKTEQLAMILRMLGRFSNQINRGSDSAQTLFMDERYKKIQQRTREELENFTEHELLDILFWYRRFKTLRTARSDIFHSDKEWSRLFQRIQELSKNKIYNCRNMINIYYDFSNLNLSGDFAANEIYSEIKTDTKVLTTFSSIQLLQAACQRGNISNKEYLMLNLMVKHINDIFDQFDLEQKSLIFRYLSKLELNFNLPRYSWPSLLNKLKNELKEKLEQLSESIVINILIGYQTLPKELGMDLLDEIKETVTLTLQHNASNIKSLFLVDFLVHTMSYRGKKKRVSEDGYNVINHEIAQRIEKKDDEIIKYKSMEKLIDIYSKHIKSEEAAKAIYQYYLEKIDVYKNLQAIELFIKYKVDASQFIKKITNEIDQYKIAYLFKVYLILSHVKAEPEIIKLLEPKIQEFVKAEPCKAIFLIKSVSLYNSDRSELIYQIAQNIKEIYPNKHTNNLFFKAIFESCENKEILKIWTNFLQKDKLPKSDENDNFRFIESFFSMEEHHNEAALLFFSTLSHLEMNPNLFKRILNGVKHHKKVLFYFERNDLTLSKFAEFVYDYMLREGKSIRAYNLFSIILKFEANRVRSTYFYQALEKILAMKSDNEIYMQIIYTQFLLNSRNLSPRVAEILYERFKDSPIDIPTKTKLFNLSLVQEKNISESQIETCKSLLKELNYVKTSTSTAKYVIQNISTLLTFPTSVIEDQIDSLSKDLKEYIGVTQPFLFMNLIRSFVPIYILRNRRVYQPILKEIQFNLSKFVSKMSVWDLISTLQSFSSIKLRNPGIFNVISENLLKHIANLKNEDITTILRCLSQAGFIQHEHIDKFLSKLMEKTAFYSHRKPLGDTLKVLISFGYSSEYIKKTFLPNMINSIKNMINPFPFMSYVTILGLDNEQEIFESCFKILNNIPPGDVYRRNFPEKDVGFLYLYLKYNPVYREKSYETNVSSILSKENLEKCTKYLNNSDREQLFCNNMIIPYLKCMKIEYDEKYVKNEIKFNLYLPEQKIAIVIFNELSYLLDRKTPRGLTILKQKVAKTVNDSEVVFLSIPEFKSCLDHLQKLKFLQEHGIKSTVPENEFDFTVLTPENSKKETETEIEAVEAIEEDQEKVAPNAETNEEPIMEEESEIQKQNL